METGLVFGLRDGSSTRRRRRQYIRRSERMRGNLKINRRDI